MEIAEEDEEEQQPNKRQSLIKDGKEDGNSLPGGKVLVEPTEPVKLDSDLAISPENSKFSAVSTSEVPSFVGAGEFSGAGDGRRLSSQSGRDIHTSYSSFSTYSKPKVKIGPRPSLDTNPRPQTAGNFRPVSSIPAGFKLFGKGSNKKSGSPSLGRKDSVGSLGNPANEISDITFATTVPSPEESGDKENLGVPRPATSSGVSTRSTNTMASKHAMTPEKARLKKAMQLREKKRKQAANTLAVPSVPTVQPDAGETIVDEEHPAADAEQRIPIIKADSGIVIDASHKDDQGSELTISDSRPTSPVIASSEAAQSTKASSISDSTEQTVHGEEEAGGKGDKVVDSRATATTSTISTTVEQATASGQTTSDSATAEKASESTDEANKVDKLQTAPDTEADVPKPTKEAEAGDDQANSTTVPTTLAGDSHISANIPASTQPNTQQVRGEDCETPRIPVNPLDMDTELAENDKDSHTLDVPTPLPSAPQETSSATTSPNDAVGESFLSQAQQNVDDEEVSDTDTIPARPSTEPSSAKRKPFIDPIRVDLANRSRPVSTAQSDFNFSDSESLMEELQSATVQEAKPMIVSKTPVTPVFPGKLPIMSSPGSTQAAHAKPLMVRTVSNPVRGSFIPPPSDVSQSSARSVSQGAAYLHQITQQRTGDNGLGKKNNVGSSISQRIKALELLSVSTAETASQPGSRPSSTFFSVKKDRVPSRSPSVADRATSLSRDNTRPTTSQSRGDSPETSKFHRDRSGSISSRLSMFEPADSPGNQPRGRPETVSVTARIMRDSPSTSRHAADRSPIDLKQSLLSVDHQRSDGTDGLGGQLPSERETSHSREPSKDGASRRSSFTIVKDFIKEGRKSITSPSMDNLMAPPGSSGGSRSPPPAHQNNSSFASRLSISSRRSLSRDRGSISPSVITEGSASGDETKSNSDKKKSRTSRLMRRLSSLSGTGTGSNRNKVSSPAVGTPTVTEEEWPESKANTSTLAVDMGDVNVQFPDTLLWKRRNMFLDNQGFLILSAAAQQQPVKTTGVKRYHLGEFRAPFIPDVEVQELPNSVVLDLLEGSAVQIACEDRSGQMKVLNGKSHPFPYHQSEIIANSVVVLQDAYAAHAAKLG